MKSVGRPVVADHKGIGFAPRYGIPERVTVLHRDSAAEVGDGVRSEIIVKRFLTELPAQFEVIL